MIVATKYLNLQQLLDHTSFHKKVRSSHGIEHFRIVCEAERVIDRGEQVTHVDRIVDRLTADLVARAVRLSAANAAAG